MDSDLLLLVGREGVDDPVDGALGPGGVQRAKDHVTGLGRGDRTFDRFQVAHFADQDHVRIHPQGSTQGFAERRHVDTNLALVHRATLVLVVVLDRILERDHMVIHRVVHVVDHAGQGGRLATAGGAGDQEQAARPIEQLLDRFGWQPELLEGQEQVGDLPQHHRDVATLLEDRDAESSLGAKGEPEVRPAHFLQLLLVPLGSDTLHQTHHVVGFESLGFEFDHAAVETDDGRLLGGEMQIADPLADHRLEQLVNLKCRHRLPSNMPVVPPRPQ